MSNQYLLKPKRIGNISIYPERSTIEHIYNFPEDYLVVGQQYVDKLREYNYQVKGNKFFLVYFNRKLKEGGIVFESETGMDEDGKGKQGVIVGVDPAKFNSLSENEKSQFIVKLIAKILKEYYARYDIDTTKIEEVKTLILKYGGDLEVVYKKKETNKYKLTISYQTKPHDKADAIIEYEDKNDIKNNKKLNVPIRFYDEIDHLIKYIKVKNGQVFMEKKS